MERQNGCDVKEVKLEETQQKSNPNLTITLEIYVKKKNHLGAKYAKTKIVSSLQEYFANKES